ncbi:MAG: class II aldolase/adducin family protein [Actinomycetota bacterium]|nr:class II aldolase/adducin family protein [Actinomycetota bacterium]
MHFEPTPTKLIPDMSPREELVVLARCLWREGYSDHLAGHITYNLGDGTLLCNPWLITWDELRPHQVIRIDLEGNLVEGDWPVPLGIPLHLALHKARPGVAWAMHNHPLYGTVLADMKVVPPAMDQSSSLGGGELVLVDEYEGGVNNMAAADDAVRALGDADLALLCGHGVFVIGASARAIHQRAVALEQRCQHAWHIMAAGHDLVSPLPQFWTDRMLASDGNSFHGFWEAMVRKELREDPGLLADPSLPD